MQYNSIEDFVIQQLELLNLERDAEIAESRRLQENISAKQLQEKGVCILNLVVQGIRSGLYGRTIIAFGCKLAGKELPSSNLSSGNFYFVVQKHSSSNFKHLLKILSRRYCWNISQLQCFPAGKGSDLFWDCQLFKIFYY